MERTPDHIALNVASSSGASLGHLPPSVVSSNRQNSFNRSTEEGDAGVATLKKVSPLATTRRSLRRVRIITSHSLYLFISPIVFVDICRPGINCLVCSAILSFWECRPHALLSCYSCLATTWNVKGKKNLPIPLPWVPHISSP